MNAYMHVSMCLAMHIAITKLKCAQPALLTGEVPLILSSPLSDLTGNSKTLPHIAAGLPIVDAVRLRYDAITQWSKLDVEISVTLFFVWTKS